MAGKGDGGKTEASPAAAEAEAEAEDASALDDDEPVISGTGTVLKDVSSSNLDVWSDLLSKWDTVSRSRQVVLVRKGIPDPLRDQVWRRLALTTNTDELLEAYRFLLNKESPQDDVGEGRWEGGWAWFYPILTPPPPHHFVFLSTTGHQA